NRVAMTSNVRLVESRDGKLSELETTLAMGGPPTTIAGAASGQELKLRTTTGEQSYERELKITSDLLGPEGVRRLSCARLHAAGDSIRFATFVAELGLPATVTRTRLAVDAETPADGLHIREDVDGMPSRTLWLDRDGRLLRTLDVGPFGDMRAEITDRAAALA